MHASLAFVRSRIRSVTCALAGLAFLLRSQRNAQLHLAASAAVPERPEAVSGYSKIESGSSSSGAVYGRDLMDGSITPAGLASVRSEKHTAAGARNTSRAMRSAQERDSARTISP